MQRIIYTLVVGLSLLFGFGVAKVNAQITACSGWNCSYTTEDGNTTQVCTGTPAGCDSNVTGIIGQNISCPAGWYVSNNICTKIGGGCPCGEFYACPTANNPGKMCACCPAQAACRNARVDCPAGTVRTSTVVGTMCEKVNNEGICGGIGSAQRSFTDVNNCCRFYYPPDECEEKCQNGRCWEVCYEQPGWCTNALIRTYSCVSTCNATAPTNVSVVQGASATAANLNWTPGTNGVSQRLWVDEDLPEVGAGCPTPNDCVVNTTLASSTNSYIVTRLAPSTTYYFNILTYKDNTCARGTVVSYATPANNMITGNVYLDTNNTCSTATRLTTGGMTATIRGTAYSGAVTNGTFSFAAGTETSYSNLDLSGIPAGYSCSTAPGCNHCLTLSPATSGSANNFFLTPQREAWWQVVGASIYSGATGGGNTVRSELPSSSTPLIAPGAGGAIGALLRASGTVDTGAGSVSDLGYSTLARYRGKIMNYEYFVAHMGVL